MNSYLVASLGGALIGLSSAILLIALGRIAGISGIVGSLVTGAKERWRTSFVVGLLLGGFALAQFLPQSLAVPSPTPLWGVVVAGLLVGVGTSLGSGCTSGHGICGLGRLSPRSLAATAMFMATGMLSATVIRALVL